MNHNNALKVLSDAYNKEAKADFTVYVSPAEARSLLTILRHMQAAGKVADFHLIDENTGEIEVYGYDPNI